MANKNFFENAIDKLQKLSVLEINTVVGNFSFVENTNNLEIDVSNTNNDRLVSRINMLTGDISTAMSEKFVDEYKELREFHAVRENQGHEIVNRNIAVLKEIATAIKDFIKDKEEVGEKLTAPEEEGTTT